MTFPKILTLYILLGALTSCVDSTGTERVSSSFESSDEETQSDESGCKFEDGTHSATVDYYNPETGYSQIYTLDVEIENCEVIQINFPNGGWLDSDHITPEELNEDGSCTIEGEDSRTYEIQIDN